MDTFKDTAINAEATARESADSDLRDEINSINSSMPKIQSGSVNPTFSAGSVAQTNITFDSSFSETPVVMAMIRTSSTNSVYGNLTLMVYSVSTTGFTLKGANASSSSMSPNVDWVAIQV